MSCHLTSRHDTLSGVIVRVSEVAKAIAVPSRLFSTAKAAVRSDPMLSCPKALFEVMDG